MSIKKDWPVILLGILVIALVAWGVAQQTQGSLLVGRRWSKPGPGTSSSSPAVGGFGPMACKSPNACKLAKTCRDEFGRFYCGPQSCGYGEACCCKPFCGDREVNQTTEQCDDGNNKNGDGCDAKCRNETKGATCGNGQKEKGEQCDDGNTKNGDGCDAQCRLCPLQAKKGDLCGGCLADRCHKDDLGTACERCWRACSQDARCRK